MSNTLSSGRHKCLEANSVTACHVRNSCSLSAELSYLRRLTCRMTGGDSAPQNGRKIIAKLEERLRSLESELDHEQRRHGEASKNLRKADRRIKELLFQVSVTWWCDY